MTKENRVIKVEALINAETGNIWDFWTLPKHIIHWNNASDDWHTTSVENDLKVGGTFKYRMEAMDGSFGFDFSGVYYNVVPNEVISYTLDDGRKVTNTFELIDGRTKLTQIFEPEAENSHDLQRSGWQSILNNFKKYAEEKKDDQSQQNHSLALV